MVCIKESGSNKFVSLFDLFGDTEYGLSKGLAYLLASEEKVFCSCMKDLFGITYIKKYFKELSVTIEKSYQDKNRSDIELIFGDYHIIFENKVKNNKLNKKQNERYKKDFEKNRKKYLCLITESLSDYRISKKSDITIKYKTWFDIMSIFENNLFDKNKQVKNFKQYYERVFKMNNIKEILVQDLSSEDNVNLFNDYGIYKRNNGTGFPLYFAPYFTKKNKNVEGIEFITKVICVYTGTAGEIIEQKNDLTNYAENFVSQKFSKDEQEEREKEVKSLVDKWIKGLGSLKDDSTEYTFYFLGEKIKLFRSLKKDGGNKKGRGKNWIAAMISKNRCVSFEEFIKHLCEK